MRAKIVALGEKERRELNGEDLDVEMRDAGEDEDDEDEDGREKDPVVRFRTFPFSEGAMTDEKLQMTLVKSILEPALESSMKAARTIINYLLQKCVLSGGLLLPRVVADEICCTIDPANSGKPPLARPNLNTERSLIA